MGRHSYAVPRIVAFPGDVGHIRVGNFCSINGEVKIFVGGEHRADWVSTFPFRIKMDLPGAFEDGCPRSKGDVEIGHDVWIGHEALILSGVTIGNGAIVGARAVVARDVPPYAVVAGNPAKFVRWRFPEREREALLRVAWWHWPDEKLEERVRGLNGDAVTDFLTEYDAQYRREVGK